MTARASPTSDWYRYHLLDGDDGIGTVTNVKVAFMRDFTGSDACAGARGSAAGALDQLEADVDRAALDRAIGAIEDE
jgi:hypothetical protein